MSPLIRGASAVNLLLNQRQHAQTPRSVAPGL